MPQENNLPRVKIDSWLRPAIEVQVDRSAVVQTLLQHQIPEAAIAATTIMVSGEVAAEPDPDPEKDFISRKKLHILYPLTSKAPQDVTTLRWYAWGIEAIQYFQTRSHELSRTLATLLMCQVVHHIQEVEKRNRPRDKAWLLRTAYENASLDLVKLSPRVSEN